jgi:hypothetical protein
VTGVGHRRGCIAERGVTVVPRAVPAMVDKNLKTIITQMHDKIVFYAASFASMQSHPVDLR